jgi:hypothetical protein
MVHDDKERRGVKNAYGRYSASDQADERRSKEVRDHGVYGHRPEDSPGHERERSTARRPTNGQRSERKPRSPSRTGQR